MTKSAGKFADGAVIRRLKRTVVDVPVALWITWDVPRVLLVAATTGYQTRAFADAGRYLGIDLVLATDRCHVLEDPWGDRAIPVRFDDPPSARDLLVAAGPFEGIVAVADRPTLVAALAAEALGIRYHSPASVEACHDKYLARQRFEAAGLPVPKFFRVSATADPLDTAV